MTAFKRCDGCGQEISEHAGELHLTDYRQGRAFGSDAEGDYCSPGCLLHRLAPGLVRRKQSDMAAVAAAFRGIGRSGYLAPPEWVNGDSA